MLQLFIPLAAIAAVFYALAHFSGQDIQLHLDSTTQQMAELLPESLAQAVRSEESTPPETNDQQPKPVLASHTQPSQPAPLPDGDPTVEEVLSTETIDLASTALLTEATTSESQASDSHSSPSATDLTALNHDTAARLAAYQPTTASHTARHQDQYQTDAVLALNRNTAVRMQAIDQLLSR